MIRCASAVSLRATAGSCQPAAAAASTAARRNLAFFAATNTMDVSSDEARARAIEGTNVSYIPFAFMCFFTVLGLSTTHRSSTADFETNEKGLAHKFYCIMTRNKPASAPVDINKQQ